MTANQLKYWELRWKQHYENEQIKIDWAKLQLEYDKLRETKRHNVKSERIEQQRVIIEQQKISQNWIDLDRKERAMAIDAAFKYVEATQKNIQLSNEQMKIANDYYNILSKEKIAVAELIVDLYDKQSHWNNERSKVFVESVGEINKAWGAGAGAIVAASLANMGETKQFEALKDDMIKMFPQYAELFGPEAANRFRNDAAKSTPSNATPSTAKFNPDPPYKGEDAMEWARQQRSDITEGEVKDYLNTVAGFSGTDQSNTGITVGKYGSNYYSNHKQAGSTKQSIETKSGNTGVIYSPGSHYGPGY